MVKHPVFLPVKAVAIEAVYDGPGEFRRPGSDEKDCPKILLCSAEYFVIEPPEITPPVKRSPPMLLSPLVQHVPFIPERLVVAVDVLGDGPLLQK